MLKHLTYIVCLKQSLKLVFNITATLLKEQEKKTGKKFAKGGKKDFFAYHCFYFSVPRHKSTKACHTESRYEGEKVLSNVQNTALLN